VNGIADQNILNPANSWSDSDDFEHTLRSLAVSFTENFEKYTGEVSAEIVEGGPALE